LQDAIRHLLIFLPSRHRLASMSSRLSLLLVANLAAVAAVWPQVSSISSGETSLLVIPSDDFFQSAATGDLGEIETLQDAYARYASLTFPHPASKVSVPSTDAEVESVSGRRLGHSHAAAHVSTKSIQEVLGGEVKLTGMVIKVEDASEDYPQLDTDESYTLTIDTQHGSNGFITAHTIYGALRALETFSQLIYFDFDTATYHIDPMYGAPLSIHDSPRFPHRGLMIDTARHFLPMKTIKHAIDSMSYAKLNVLHWHLSDSQSFPLQFISRPKLWEGSHSLKERYLQQEVRDVVEYARKRGVRVIPEFDVPGHAASWCTGYPEICPSDSSCKQPLNVARNETFELIDNIVSECVEDDTENNEPMFHDKFFHLGGDEVDTSCWEKDGEISAWLRNHSMQPDDGYSYFVKKAASIVIGHGRRPVQWSEVYDHFKKTLDPSTIVHIWKSVTNVSEVAEDGYNVLVNVGYANGSWYLDNLNRAWDEVYGRDPCRGIREDRSELCQKVLGGHGEMWGKSCSPLLVE